VDQFRGPRFMHLETVFAWSLAHNADKALAHLK